MLDLVAKPLHGKTALVTGAARRFGEPPRWRWLKPARMWPSRSAKSAREARDTVIDLSGFGVRAFALRFDVTDETMRPRLIKEAGRELGRIDILVNNAANYERWNSKKLTVRQWERNLRLNTRGHSGVARSAEMDGEKTQQRLSADRGKNHQHGIAWRTAYGPTHAHYCSSEGRAAHA